MNKNNSGCIQGIIFCGGGLWLLSHSIISQSKAFNKAWSQSPYLFPALIGAALIALSISLLVGSLKNSEETAEKFELSRYKGVIVTMLVCVGYYVSLKLVKMPLVTVNIVGNINFSFCVFEVMTLIFLLVMMLFMGVRKKLVLLTVPVGTTIFLSIAFRTFLHVLLP